MPFIGAAVIDRAAYDGSSISKVTLEEISRWMFHMPSGCLPLGYLARPEATETSQETPRRDASAGPPVINFEGSIPEETLTETPEGTLEGAVEGALEGAPEGKPRSIFDVPNGELLLRVLTTADVPGQVAKPIVRKVTQAAFCRRDASAARPVDDCESIGRFISEEKQQGDAPNSAFAELRGTVNQYPLSPPMQRPLFPLVIAEALYGVLSVHSLASRTRVLRNHLGYAPR